jgi:hypothetical protein
MQPKLVSDAPSKMVTLYKMSRPTNDMIARWDLTGIPVEVRLCETLNVIERLREENEKLKRRVHNQRVANRETWEIVEMRRKWLGSDTARRMYCNLLKSYQKLAREKLHE